VEKLTKPGPELAVEDGALEQEVGAAAGPPHLLGLGHAAIDQEVGRCFGQRGTEPPGLSPVRRNLQALRWAITARYLLMEYLIESSSPTGY
jgi:hypothetical protein